MRSNALNTAAMIPPASRRSKTAGWTGGGPRASSGTSRPNSPSSLWAGRSASATPAGRRMASRRSPTPIRTLRLGSPSSTTASSRTSGAARGALRQGIPLRHRDQFRGRGVRGRGRAGVGQDARAGGACGASTPARRVRARLSVCGRGRPADRGAPRRAARDRLRRRRDVSRLGRAGSRPLHRSHRLPRGGRLGGGDARRRRHSATRDGKRVKRRIQRSPPAACSRRRATIATSWPRRSTSSPKSSAIPSPITSTWRAMRLKPFAWPVDPAKLARVTIVACGTAYMAGLSAKYWIERFARLPVEIEVASEYRYREAPVEEGRLDDCRVAIGRDGRHARFAALCEGEGIEDGRRRQRAEFEHRPADRRARADARGSGDRRRVDQGLHLPAAALAALAIGLGKARGTIDEAAETALVGELVATPGLLAEALKLEPRSRSSPMRSPAPATFSTSAAARLIRWRSRAR